VSSEALPPSDTLAEVYALLQQSRLQEAGQALSLLTLRAPRDPAVHRARAVAAQIAGRPDAAIDAMRTAVELAPGAAALWMELGQLLASAMQIDEAIAAFRRATAQHPDLIGAWYFLGMTLYGARRDAEALPVLARAHALAPEHPQILRALAETEYALEYNAEALTRYERIAAAGQDVDAMLFLRLSQCRRRLGEPQAALRDVCAALERFPDDAPLRMERGWVYEDLGDAAQAQEAYAHAHALRPDWGDPLAASIALLRADAPEDLVREADAMLVQATVSEHEQAYLHYVLGKRDDARGDYAEAARHWSAANALRRHVDNAFDRAEFSVKVDAAIATLTSELLRSRHRDSLPDERPLFIVGMPRSGTTLVEQILAAHPQVYGCGEMTGIVTIAQDAFERTGLLWPQEAARFDAAWLRDRAADYLQVAAKPAPDDAQRLVDKQPYNFLHVGLIAMLFADARIVWCRRDPRDVALSIFSESFSPLSSYATDLEDIRFFIDGQERLMRHWRSVSPLPMLEVRYEEVVADTEAQARRLIDFAGLPWDPGCLEFHRSGRSVQTLSRWQVRQPVHTRSVGRWRNYPQWFGDGT
jgi:tetratricopeptide (TPR) repeat protein